MDRITKAFNALWKKRPNDREISGTARQIQRAVQLDGMSGATFASSLPCLKDYGYTVKKRQGSSIYTVAHP